MPSRYAPIQSYFEFLREESKETKNYRRSEIEGAVEIICAVALILQIRKLAPRKHPWWNNGENSGSRISYPNHFS